jgi:hypothetical protein
MLKYGGCFWFGFVGKGLCEGGTEECVGVERAAGPEAHALPF